MKRPFLPPNRQGIAIDAIAIVANLVLFPYLLGRVGNLFDRSFTDDDSAFMTLAGLMMFILATRLLGLYLKRFPLQSRLAGETSFPLYFFVLNVGVFVMNAAFVMVFLSAAAGELGLVETGYDGRPKDSAVLMVVGSLGMLIVTVAEIYLIYRLTRPLTEREENLRTEGNWLFDWRGEFAADFGLFAYMMVWQVFYNNTAKLMMTPPENAPDTLEYRIISAVFLLVVFLLFYISPRTVFLIEDRKYVGTWVFILGVYVASVVRYW
ncbi:MAG TPA: hypothetical protein VJV05_09080 [Pyrinomonadaceae bacterium]|nr:hypothetical protein [Pyrinomonadaceae bacterium]